MISGMFRESLTKSVVFLGGVQALNLKLRNASQCINASQHDAICLCIEYDCLYVHAFIDLFVLMYFIDLFAY